MMGRRETWPGKSPKVLELISERKLKRYTVRRELVDPGVRDMPPMEIESAFTHEGLYIGGVKLAEILCNRRGVKPEKIHPADPACRIGFSETAGKWYGWSHKAMYGFKPGDRCTWDDVHFHASNRAEFVKVLREEYELDDFRDVELEETEAGVVVTRVRMLEGHDTKLQHTEPWPERWGRGEWQAESTEDARQMAIDFAEAVS
jgi:hypothetical protein